MHRNHILVVVPLLLAGKQDYRRQKARVKYVGFSCDYRLFDGLGLCSCFGRGWELMGF